MGFSFCWLQLSETRRRLDAVEMSRDELGVKLSRSEAALQQLQVHVGQLACQKQVRCRERPSCCVPFHLLSQWTVQPPPTLLHCEWRTSFADIE